MFLYRNFYNFTTIKIVLSKSFRTETNSKIMLHQR